jgi:transglutaminase-like putative cysteine protease
VTYRVTHRTSYEYGTLVTASHTIAHLVPRATAGQEVQSTSLVVEPQPDHTHEHLDAFGNHVVYFGVNGTHDRMSVTASSEVEVTAEPAPPGPGTAWDRVARVLAAEVGPDVLLARLCSLDSTFVERSHELADYARPSFAPGRPLPQALAELNTRIFHDFTFDPGFSDVSTPLTDVLAHRRGVCQDFAHLAIGCLRSLGLPARYVSGYIETIPPPGEAKLVGSDASHAWLSVYDPAEGWIDADPTNDQLPPHAHVTTAWGRDYADVAPVRGVVFGPPGQHALLVAVDVERI